MPLKAPNKDPDSVEETDKLLQDRIVSSGLGKPHKRDRDAMVAQIFASKKSMKADLAAKTQSVFSRMD